jgi:CHAD domain-containing protein
VKARPVKGLDPKDTLRANAARIIAVRVDEVCSFDPAIRDPGNVTELHDMRIAAKRLRYVLEICGFAFGPEMRQAEREAKWLQDVLGEVHDCDVLTPLVQEHLTRLRDADAAWLTSRAAAPTDLDALLAGLASVPNRTRHRGLEVLGAYVEARRSLLYRQFLDRWDILLRDRWRDRIEAELEAA